MVNIVTYFALIFKLVETPGGGGGYSYGLDYFAGFRKMNIFGGMKKLWIFLGGHYIIGLIWGIISIYILGLFLKASRALNHSNLGPKLGGPIPNAKKYPQSFQTKNFQSQNTTYVSIENIH